MTLLPVVLTSFMTMPLSLGRHPGDRVSQGSTAQRLMS